MPASRTIPALLRLALIVAIVCAGAWTPLRGLAQDEPAGAPGADPRATPREAMLGYLEACREGDFALAAQFMDLSSLPAASRAGEGPRLARHLKIVLDQKLWIDVEALSTQPEGSLEDGLPRRDRVGVIQTASGEAEVVLERSGDGKWRIGRSTVLRTDALYEEFGLGLLGEILPQALFRNVGDLQLWQALALLALVLVAYVLGSVAASLLQRAARRVASRTETRLDDRVFDAITAPLSVTLLLIFFYLGSLALRLATPVRSLIGSATEIAALAAITWLALRLIDVASHTIEEHLTERGDTTALTIIPIGRRVAKVFLVVIAGLSGLQNLGYNVVGLIAGLGVVGLAVAFAAQKTIENFFGALAILGDRPVRRGDFCRFGDNLGTIEDIGLRSTRVRTLDRTLVTIPNAEFSALQIESFAARDQIRFFIVLGVRYETTADQLRHLLIHLKELLVRHPRVVPEPARVRFIGFGASSLDIEVHAYIDTSDWNEFLAVREDLMLRMIDVVESSGSGFAFPSQTLYIGRDEGVDGERARAAQAEVARWREARELCLPDVPATRLREIRHTLAYPEEGAAVAAGSATGEARPPSPA